MNVRTKGAWRVSASSLAICLAATAAEAQSASPATEGTSAASLEPATLEEIVVTASKREQKLRDVPTAITVLGGDDLSNQGVQSIRDYATLTPGLSLKDNAYPGFGTIFIRGLTTGAGQQSSTSVYYMDDLPFTSSSPESGAAFLSPDPELADVDRIEVLKGPQGTLYGASSLGGVIRVISKQPDPASFSGNARTEMTAIDGGGIGYTLRGSANIPLVADHLAMRATVFYRDAPGFADNVGTGTQNVNKSTSRGGRLALRWLPIDRLTVDVVGLIQNTGTNGPAFQTDISGTTTPLYGPRKFTNYFDAPSEIRYRLASATLNYDAGIGHVIATGGYLESKFAVESDDTPLYAAYLPLLGYPTGTGVDLESGIPLEKKTAELRFVSNRLGPTEFIVGGFYTHEHVFSPTDVTTRNTANNALLPSPLDNLIASDVIDTYQEASAFGNVTFYLADNLDITGGVRRSHYKEDNTITYGGLFYGGQSLALLHNIHEDVTSYLATARWRLTSTLSAFVRAASGYRPGGPQSIPNPPPGAQTQINPDTVWNYEAGLKGDFLNDRISVEASAYHIDWKNIQLTSSSGAFLFLANAGKAEVDGFELEALARPTRLLSVGANLGYTDARLTQVEPGVTASIGASKGDPLPLTSRWTASATIDQRIPLPVGLQGQVGGTVREQSPTFNSYPGSLTDLNVRLPSITTLDLRAGLVYKSYLLQLRAENIFDRNGISNITASPGVPSTATVIRPRSFTLALSTNF